MLHGARDVETRRDDDDDPDDGDRSQDVAPEYIAVEAGPHERAVFEWRQQRQRRIAQRQDEQILADAAEDSDREQSSPFQRRRMDPDERRGKAKDDDAADRIVEEDGEIALGRAEASREQL